MLSQTQTNAFDWLAATATSMALQRIFPPDFHVFKLLMICRGDSWRARVTHIYELQFNMSHLGMKIDFGGLDKWDFKERTRNLEEAASLR